MKKLKILGYALLALSLILAITAWVTYAPLPKRDSWQASDLPIPARDSELQSLISQETAQHKGLSGIETLTKGEDAFAMRAVLAATASQTIDAQYYIWHDDTAGRLLLSALRDAADRGVRVRLLLDDNNTGGMDALLASLNAHPNISIRLFNPFMQRDFRPFGYLSDFFRLNRRMHNKSFTVDKVATVIGGRNIGDEYFNVGSGVMFADLDVLAVGEVVDAVSQDFARYWDSQSVYPLEVIIPTPDQATRDSAEATLTAVKSTQSATTYLQAIAETPLIDKLRAHSIPAVWANTQLISDDPIKGLKTVDAKQTVLGKMRQQLGEINQRLTLVSPYFVPTQAGSDALVSLSQSGIKVEVLTNSLAATDVAPVHAGYAKYRRELLASGVRLYELKPETTVTGTGYDKGITGSSGSSLHAKTFSVDGERLFVGSFNMDPRSANINTEMGFLIDSPVLAKQMEQSIDNGITKVAYQVQLNNGKLQWQDGDKTLNEEPDSTLFKRILLKVLTWLPIEFLL